MAALAKECHLKYQPVIKSGQAKVQQGNVWKRINIHGTIYGKSQSWHTNFVLYDCFFGFGMFLDIAGKSIRKNRRIEERIDLTEIG